MTDTAPPEQILTEAADRAVELAGHLTGEPLGAGTHLAYLAGLIRGGITNVVAAYDRGWDEGYDAAPTPLAAPADMAAVWQGLNDEQRAVVCIVSPELAGMLDAAENPAPEVKTETQAEPPPHYLARLRLALGQTREAAPTFDEAVDRVRTLRGLEELAGEVRLAAGRTAEQYHDALVKALGAPPEISAVDALEQAVGVITRARHAARLWSGNAGEPTQGTTTQALRDLVRYLDERAA